MSTSADDVSIHAMSPELNWLIAGAAGAAPADSSANANSGEKHENRHAAIAAKRENLTRISSSASGSLWQIVLDLYQENPTYRGQIPV